MRKHRAGWPVLAAVALVCAGGQAAAAQTATLEGQVLGPDGPLPDLTVALHRVTDEGGANIDEVVTDDDGRFTFVLDLTAADSAVYFAATRVHDELYVGPPIREVPLEPYVIQIGPGGMAVPLGGAGPVGPAATQVQEDSNAGTLAVFLVIGLVMVGGVAFAVRQTLAAGPDRRRALLVELAELEEALDGDVLDDAERASYEERRAELRGRLVGGG